MSILRTEVSRRAALQVGALGAITVASCLSAPAVAQAAGRPSRPRTRVTDLGPGLVEFGLMSGLLVGDTMYIGSRNLSPTRVAAYHVPTRTVTAATDLGPGKFVQGLAADPTGRYLYTGIVYDGDDDQPNLYRWDLSTPGTPATAIGRIPGLYVRNVAVAPDGIVYYVGKEKNPGIWAYDPATGTVVNVGIPDPGATQSRAIAASASTIYYGAGSNLAGGGGASKASLFAVDRVTHEITSIIPPELVDDSAARDMAIIGDHLYAGTEASGGNAHIAMIPLADPTDALVVEVPGKSAKLFREHEGDIYFAITDPGRLVRYRPGETQAEVLQIQGEIGEIWGLDIHGNTLLVTSAAGLVVEVDLTTLEATSTRLVDAGAPADPQLGMSVAAGAGAVYVGGNGTIARHDLKTGKVQNFLASGEAKDSLVLGGVLYTGQYSSVGFCAYDPAVDDRLRVIGALPREQNRPQDIDYDRRNRMLVAGVQSDSKGGGALATYSFADGAVRLAVNPFGEEQMVRAVSMKDGIAYLAGENTYKTGLRGEIAAWDPVRMTELWRLDPGTAKGIASLASHGHHLYAIGVAGELVVVDLRRPRIVHRADLRALVPSRSRLAVSRGRVYGVSVSNLFRIDPKTFAATSVVSDLDGQWYGTPDLSVDEKGRIYTFRGRHLIQVDDKR